MKGGIKIIKVALNQIKRKPKAMTILHEVRFKGKHIAWDKIERHYHSARSGIKMALHKDEIKGNENGQS